MFHVCLRKIYTLLLLNRKSYRCLFDPVGVWFMQILCLCCTSAQLFYPLFKENIEIYNYYCFNCFSTQCFHFPFCVFRGSVIRYIHVYNCYTSSDCHFYKSSSLSLTIVPYFCLIWQSRALCIVYAFNLHSVFFQFFCYQILCIFWLMCNFYHCVLCFLPAPQSTFWPNSLTQLPLMLLLK